MTLIPCNILTTAMEVMPHQNVDAAFRTATPWIFLVGRPDGRRL